MGERDRLSTTPSPALSPIAALAQRAKASTPQLAVASSADKNVALTAMAAMLRARRREILEANAEDLRDAREAVIRGELGEAFVDRLALSDARIDEMAAALEEVVALADPVGGTDEEWLRPNGLRVGKRRIPLGVIGIIYEARPNVTSDAAGLCLKAGNAVVLKGGGRALRSNRAVVEALRAGLESTAIPADAVQFVDSVDRDSIRELLEQESFVDLIIPRGGEGLIRYVAQHSRIPVIKHYKGVCHLYVDRAADADKAVAITLNAKVQRPSVCNAAETLLVHHDLVDTLLIDLARALVDAGVTLHLDPTALDACRRHGVDPARCVAATDADYHAEYLSLDIAVAVVEGVDEAIAHIGRYGSDHTESILTEDLGAATRFVDAVQSSVVAVNASTRFSDGNQLGLGAEIGVSTTKLHAYGPMGLRELTTTKFVVFGNGQTRT